MIVAADGGTPSQWEAGLSCGHIRRTENEQGGPFTLFPWADALQTERLERICRDLALAWGRDHLVDGQTLFVNINGAYAAMPINPSEIECVPERVTLEISEQYDILDNTALLNQLQEWRTQGHLLVFDDYGTGYAAAATVLAIHPPDYQIGPAAGGGY